MPVSVNYISSLLFSTGDDALDFSKVPDANLDKAKASKREKMFSELLAEKGSKEELRNFLAKHTDKENLGKFLFGDDFKLAPQKLADEIIEQKFNTLKAKHGYEVSLEDFKKATKAVLFTADVIEHNNNGEEVYERAYKILGLFKDLKTFDKFASAHHSNTPNPVHDLLQFDLPQKNEGLDLEAWRKVVMQMGKSALVGFAKANEIKGVPDNRSELELALSKLTYDRAEENPEFAKLCTIYKTTKETFNRTLDLIKDGTIKLKTTDNIPSVVVSAEELDASAKGVYLLKLPAGNLRGAILGDITDCCQSIGSHSEKCAIDGLNRENNGFYVLVKGTNASFDVNKIDWKNLEANGKIVGQGYVWRSDSQNIVMDSWEGLGTTYDWLMPKLLPQLGKQLHEADNNINSLNIGKGGKTPAALRANGVLPEGMQEGYMYGDAGSQSGVWISDELKQLREELAKKTWINKQEHIYNLSISKRLLELTDEQLANLNAENYPTLTMPINIEWLFENIDTVPNLSKELFSNNSIEAYESGYVKVSDLKDLDNDKIKLLTSYYAIQGYKTGKVTANDLKDLEELDLRKSIAKAILSHNFPNMDVLGIDSINDNDKIKLLTSYNSLEVYKTGKVTFDDLKDLDTEKIKLLTSDYAIAAYRTGKVTANDLKDLDIDKIKLLTSDDAIKAYNKGKVTFADLKDLDTEKIKLLTSYGAIIAYKTGKVTANDLKDLSELDIWKNISKAILSDNFPNMDVLGIDSINDIEKIKLLTSYYPTAAYRTGKVTANDLKDIDNDKIKLLTSDYAIAAYRTGKVTANDLKDLDNDKFVLLTSYEVIEAYKTGKVTANDLKDLSELDIRKNISKAILANSVPTMDVLGIDSINDIEKIKLLTSTRAIDAYQTGKVTVNDLKDLDDKKIILLITNDLINIYKSGYVKVDDLKDLDIEKIKLLISYDSKEAYRAGKVTVNDLKDLENDKILLLTSDGAIELYKSEIVTFDGLKVLDNDKIILLTSDEAIELYKSEIVTFDGLKVLDNDKIKLLTSYNPLMAYESGHIKVNDLKDLENGKIELLTSTRAIDAYQTGKVTFDDLKDFSVDGIRKIIKSEEDTFKEMLDETKRNLSHADQVIGERLIVKNANKNLGT